MSRSKHSKRPTRARLLLAPITLCAATAHAAAPDPADRCIAADHAIGCVSERSVIELTIPRKDASALQQLVQDKLASGQCRVLDYGERVQVTSTRGSERTQIRRPGDKASYWIPASWARPAAECEGTQSASALHQKLGLPDGAQGDSGEDPRVPTLSDERASAPPRWDDDERHDDERHGDEGERYGYSGRSGPPPWESQRLPSSRYAHQCDFKSVMSDADLIACRALRR